MTDFDDLTDQQQAAADALDRNVTLTAGAGTGKTTTLTARYVRMLARGIEGVPEDEETPLLPEEVVTTTFTERAANELKQSVREAITDRVADADSETYAAWRQVADGLEEGYVHTVHGFCARLLREHALSVDAIDPGFETLDERETGALLEETVRTLLETHDDHPAVETLARRYDRSALEGILADLLTERPGGIDWAEEWADASVEEYLAFVNEELHPIPPDVAAERLSDPEVVAAVETLRDLLGSPPPDVDTGGQGWKRAAAGIETLDRLAFPPEATVETREAFLACCKALTTGKGERYASYTATAGRWSGADAERERFDDAMATLVDVLSPEDHGFDGNVEADRRGFPFVQALAELTLLAHEAYEERKRRRNVVDFTDQIEFALAFLEGADEDLRAELREGFAYVMVDEFQDTDPRQWEIVKHLTAEDPTDYDARNVFVVGDAKQSIYRFRNADVSAFGSTADELAAANPEAGERDDQLSTNFRTLEPVLEFCNDVFDAVFPPDEDGTPRYEATPQRLDAYRDDPDSLASVEYLLVPTDEAYRAERFEGAFATAAAEHDAELEGQALAARLTRLFAGEQPIYDPESDIDDPEPKPVEPDDVAVLLRSRTHLKKYERALEHAGVPYTVASGLGFYETPEVTALVNLLRALADPGDERALYGALRSPLFGFTDDTLARLKAEGDPLWDALAEAAHDELADAHSLLVAWREAAGLAEAPPALDGSWAAFLTRVLDETGYLTSVAADERPQQAVANVEKFREELRAFSDEGVTSLPTLVRRLDSRLDRSDREGEATVQGGGDGVRILTVHDAKGSEFPVVVVPGMAKEFNLKPAVADRVEFEDVGDGTSTYVAGLKAPKADDPFEDETTVARAALKERRLAEERAEEKRVLYVACTRARDRLLLSGTHDLDGESLADLKDADPDEPTSWRDWLQPLLLDEATLSTLDTEDRATARVDGTGVAFDVVLPQPRADWREVGEADDAEFDLSPTPPQPSLRYRLSPTDLTSLFDGDGELVRDERTNTVHYEGDDEGGDGAGSSESGEPRLAPTVFGEAVHRICELRPPRERWDDVLDQTLVEEEVDHELSAVDRERVHDHAERAIAHVDARHAEWDPEVTYDELYVTAEFERGEVGGYIDHLAVTDDAHHVVDYKTNDVDADGAAEKADDYRTQMEAYAVALAQQDPDRAVTATLYFTTPGVAETVRWSPEGVAALAEDFEAKIERELADMA
ncbi:UvrD-helicase domain-containing protein [Salinirubellus salinus]|uniref:DNA 3'-5' helicase n=1 Tax=Salinirubellus salinus TaxID=1364945 RepID=A0A9E7R1Z4_9EURY|nr:UvrD-helicase domain-containing protein [Salinirubellus salinus]UWM53378.1 UvrD-helicase domain-containing protein [Salinirubellus salinus]